MKPKLRFAVCRFLLAEARAVLQQDAVFEGMDVVPLPVCTSRPEEWGALKHLFEDLPPHVEIALIGSSCLSMLPDAPSDFKVAVVDLFPRCLDLAAPPALIDMLVSSGAHVLTPAWALSWRERLDEWKMDIATASSFFHEHAGKLALLDTGIIPDAQAAARAFAEKVSLPLEIVPVGLATLHSRFLEIVLRWRLKQAPVNELPSKELRTRLHTYAMAHDLICRLTEIGTEIEAANLLLELLDTLFAPHQAVYLPLKQDGTGGEPVPRHQNIALEPEVLPAMLKHASAQPVKQSINRVFEKNLILSIGNPDKPEAILAALDVAFPQYLDSYKEIALTISKTGGLAVRNARAYEQLVKTISDLRRAMLERNNIMAVLSHEVRSPLNVILGFADLLASSALDEEQRLYAGLITKRGNDLLNLVNQILEFSRIESGKSVAEYAPFQLMDTLNASLETAAPIAKEKNLELVLTTEPGLPDTLLGNATSLRQILVNLLGNAVKFTETGVVSLSVALDTNASDAEPVAPNKERLVFIVRDTGSGIPAARQAEVFQPFEQGDPCVRRRFGGAGLGLSIASQLVAAMAGQISLESQEGQGASFKVVIPFSAAENENSGN